MAGKRTVYKKITNLSSTASGTTQKDDVLHTGVAQKETLVGLDGIISFQRVSSDAIVNYMIMRNKEGVVPIADIRTTTIEGSDTVEVLQSGVVHLDAVNTVQEITILNKKMRLIRVGDTLGLSVKGTNTANYAINITMALAEQ